MDTHTHPKYILDNNNKKEDEEEEEEQGNR